MYCPLSKVIISIVKLSQVPITVKMPYFLHCYYVFLSLETKFVAIDLLNVIEHKNRQPEVETYRQMDNKIGSIRIDGHTYSKMDTQTDGRTDKWMDRNVETYPQTGIWTDL